MKLLTASVSFLWALTPINYGQVVSNLDTGESFATLQMAIDDSDTVDGHTLELIVADHTTPELQVVFSKDLTLRSSGVGTLRPSLDTGTAGDARGWFLIPLGRAVTFRDLAFDGTGQKIHTAIRNHGELVVRDCSFTELKFDESGPLYSGIAISHFGTGGDTLAVSDCMFSEIGRIGIHVFEPATIERCVYLGKGVGDWLDYFACVDSFGTSIGIATFTDCQVSGNRGVASVDGSTSGGMLISTFFGAGTSVSVNDCSFTDNTVGLAVGFDSLEASDVTIRDTIFAGNDFGIVNTSASTIVDAADNWWGSVTGPADPFGSIEAGLSLCVPASFTPPLDVLNADGGGDSVTDANVTYCPWRQIAPPCMTVADAQACAVAPSTLEGPDLDGFNNVLVVHHNAGTTPGTASASNVAFIEVRNAQFSTNQVPFAIPDPWNYALNMRWIAPTSDGTNLPPPLPVLDSMSGGLGEPGFAQPTSQWTIDFYDGVNSPGDLAGSRFHTVLFGDDSAGVCELVQTFATPTEQFVQTALNISDGIYHSVVSPEVNLPKATSWDGSAFGAAIPGAQPVMPFLYSETTSVELGQFSNPGLLSGSADPGFVTLWVREACTADAVYGVASNRLALDIVAPQTCYKEDDIITVELNMECLEEDVSGFFASVSFDPSLLALEASSAYTGSPFPLHIVDPIVDTGAPEGTILLDGSVAFGSGGTSVGAVLATLEFRVLTGGDGSSTSIGFTPGGIFPSELSMEGVPLATGLSSSASFLIDQSPPAITCPPAIIIGNDPGLCSAVIDVGTPTIVDACGVSSVTGIRSDRLALDAPFPADCAPGIETLVTWTTIDCAGNENTCVQSVRVIDTEVPVFSGLPTDMSVNADAGFCTANVTFTAPSATDNCDADPIVACFPPSGFDFPVGVTAVTCTATDACGNVAMASFNVEVLDATEVSVTVELAGITVPTTRCIRFVGGTCGDTVDLPLAFVDHDSNTTTPVRASTTLDIGCGAPTTLCAKDEQRTLWGSTSVSVSGNSFVADSIISLDGGDTDNDGDCDINDVTYFVASFGQLQALGGCPWDGVTRDADFSNNGATGAEDYSFLVANFLASTACPCGSPAIDPRPGRGATRILTERLPMALRAADNNRDGVVDFTDVRRFEEARELPHTLSTRMEQAERR